MIDAQVVKCPECGHSFDFSGYIGEEHLNNDVNLIKKWVRECHGKN